jgi:hypothetical protein
MTAMAEPEDYRALARGLAREQFVAACPHPFLFGVHELMRPRRPSKTLLIAPLDARENLLAPRRKRTSDTNQMLVLAVRKVQEAFPSMITVGRTANNDVVVEDVQISKFHAFFRVQGNAVELADAGSRNGTFLGELRLQPKGPAVPVRFGDHIRFGELKFILLDAASCWERLK